MSRSHALPIALIEALDDEALALLAERLAPLIAGRLSAANGDAERWLDSTDAAAHLGMTRNALHKLTAARAIAFHQDGPGCKCWFRRSELDHWRQGRAVGQGRGA